MTFLDEKDIETGQSIDTSIKKHLKDCKDFLIILSPASIKSQWTLIELGGAIALDKKVIPILLYVGANEIPQVINLKLARDINSVELYYEELKQDISGKKIKKTPTKRKVITYSYKPGERVMVVPRRPPDAMRPTTLIDWEPEMDICLGKEFTISYRAAKKFGDAYALKNVDANQNQSYVFAKEWLIPVK
jgi:hypothetical protein